MKCTHEIYGLPAFRRAVWYFGQTRFHVEQFGGMRVQMSWQMGGCCVEFCFDTARTKKPEYGKRPRWLWKKKVL